MVTIKKFSRKANIEMLFSVNDCGGYLWVSVDGKERKQIFDKNGCAIIVSPATLNSVASKESRKIALSIVEIKEIYDYCDRVVDQF